MEKYSSHASFLMSWILTIMGVTSLQNFAIVIGLLLGIGTFILNWHYKRKILNVLTSKEVIKVYNITHLTDE